MVRRHLLHFARTTLLCLVLLTAPCPSADAAEDKTAEAQSVTGAKEFLGAKKYFKALKLLDTAIDKSPLSAPLHLWRGNAYWAVCDYRRAIKDFDTAIAQNSECADGYAHKAVCLARLGLYDEAVAEFRQAAKRTTGDNTVILLVARSLFENKEYKAAIDYLDHIRSSEAGAGTAGSGGYVKGSGEIAAGICLTAAQARAATGDLESAIEDCNRAISCSPNHYLAYVARARIYQKQGQFERAIADARKAQEINKSKFPLAHLIIGESMLARDKIGEAELEISLALQEGGNTPSGEAQHYRALIIERKGNILGGLQNRAAALQLGYVDPPPLTVVGREVLSPDKIAAAFASIVVSERFICYSDLDRQKVERYSRLAEGFATYTENNLCPLQGEYPAFLFILHDKAAEQHFLKDRMDFTMHVHGVFLTAKNSVVTYDGAGVGTFLHEIMHKFLYNLKAHDFWADEGIPSFFEKSYGYLYQANNQTNSQDGQQNMWLVTGFAESSSTLWSWLTHKTLKLSQIVTSAKYADPSNEDAQRLVALFINKHGKLKQFLDTSFSGARGKYKYFIEATFDKTLAELDPMFDEYLSQLQKNHSDISKLPAAAIFDSESDWKNFLNSHPAISRLNDAATGAAGKH
ncbi:MAG: tetratricopeptide repeat protein [Cyanobacteria bacterium SZAS LIN-3]|nr:tetratricopeptide repeat protein [Cyanobacteria bacterium SZAS LIN-3]